MSYTAPQYTALQGRLVQEQALSVIHMVVQPAFRTLSHFLEMEYLPATRYV
jgi:hypothetical protein